MKKLTIFALALLTILFVSRHVLAPKMVERGFTRMVAANVGIDRTADLADGLHVYMCGAGSPLADFIFDAGTNGSQNLGPMGFPTGQTEEIFLTHLHSDHLDGLGQLLLGTWINSGRTAPTQVSGPIGTAQIVEGFNRTAHHGTKVANPASFGATAREIDLTGGTKVVYNKDGVKITAFVLFHEALNMEMVKTMQAAAKTNGAKGLEKILFDIQDYHTSPVDAAKTAKQAGASDLVLPDIRARCFR